MDDAEAAFYEVGNSIEGAETSQMFGKKCYKTDGKAFICFFQNSMVFKLQANQHFEALSLQGSVLFDPSGKKRPMKEWVQVSYEHHKLWIQFATAAHNYVSKK